MELVTPVDAVSSTRPALTIRARDLSLPLPRMLRSEKGLRRQMRKNVEALWENEQVRDWLIEKGLRDQVPWVINPPHFAPEPDPSDNP